MRSFSHLQCASVFPATIIPLESKRRGLPNEWQASSRPGALTRPRCGCDNREPQGERRPPPAVHIYFPHTILLMCWKCLRVSGWDLWMCWHGELLLDKDIIMRKWRRRRPSVWKSPAAQNEGLQHKSTLWNGIPASLGLHFPLLLLNRKTSPFHPWRW